MRHSCPHGPTLNTMLAALLVTVLIGRGFAAAQMDAEPSYIDDRALQESFAEELTELLESGRAVGMRALRDQLDRGPVDIERPQIEPSEMPLPELYRRCKDSVVIIGGLYWCDNCKKHHVSTMAGFAVTDSGIIATAYHGVDRPKFKTMGAMIADGEVYVVKEVVAASRYDDVALLQLDGTGLDPLPLSREAPVGTTVAVIAHPNHQFYTLTTGTIARYFTYDYVGVETRWISATPDIGAGASGGPLLNMAGEVVGMASRTRPVLTTSHGDQPRRVQMVIKQYVPAGIILELLDPNSDGTTNQSRRRQVNPAREFVFDMMKLTQSQSWDAMKKEAKTWIADHPDNLSPVEAVGYKLVNTPNEEAQRTGGQLARQVLTKKPDSKAAVQMLAWLAYKEERFEEATKFNERLLALDPNSIRTMNDLAWIWSEEMGRYEEALKLAKKALELEAENPNLLDTHGVICYHLKRHEEAETSLKKALKIYERSDSTIPASVSTRFHLAQVYWDSGPEKKARELFRQCLDLQSTVGGLDSEQIAEAKRRCGGASEED